MTVESYWWLEARAALMQLAEPCNGTSLVLRFQFCGEVTLELRAGNTHRSKTLEEATKERKRCRIRISTHTEWTDIANAVTPVDPSKLSLPSPISGAGFSLPLSTVRTLLLIPHLMQPLPAYPFFDGAPAIFFPVRVPSATHVF